MPDWLLFALGIINLWIGINDRNTLIIVLGVFCIVLFVISIICRGG